MSFLCNPVRHSQILAKVSFGSISFVHLCNFGCALAGLWEGFGMQGSGFGVSHVVFLEEVV